MAYPSIYRLVPILVTMLVAQSTLSSASSHFLHELSNNLDPFQAPFLLGSNVTEFDINHGAALSKRQLSCESGYGYCASINRCCPSNDKCCLDGCGKPGSQCCATGGACESGKKCCDIGCADEDRVCCSGGYSCAAGQKCCGARNCAPAGGECCGDGGACEAGNHCYKVEGYIRDRCCTNSRCTAYVENGETITASTRPVSSFTFSSISVPSITLSTTRRSSETADFYSTFDYTLTWWYYYYFWTYSYSISASIVTSTRTTTTSTVYITASDSSDASSSFSVISINPPTPAAATRLASLTDSTISSGTPTSTSDLGPSITGPVSGDNGNSSSGDQTTTTGAAPSTVRVSGPLVLATVAMMLFGALAVWA